MSKARAVIYARQSLDRKAEGAAVERQIATCRQLAELRGWEVIEILTDNDTPASGSKPRHGYQRLLKLMRAGQTDVVIVWAVDRLTRRVLDLETIIEIVETTGVKIATVTGDLDLSNDIGQMVARFLATVAQGEVKRKGARQRAANEQRANGGRMGWTRRPFAYVKAEDGSVVVMDDEAAALEAAATMVLDGGTLAAAVKMLNSKGLTTTGRRVLRDENGEPLRDENGDVLHGEFLPWNVTSLRRVLLNSRYSGRVTYNGADVTTGTWPVILPADVQERLREKLRDVRRRVQQGTDPRHLLSGLARCGRCEAVMFAAPTVQKGRRYVIYRCLACYLTRRADLVDEVVEGVLIGYRGPGGSEVPGRLAQPDAASVFAEDEDVSALRAEVTELRGRRDDLAALLADGLLSATAVRERSQQLTRRIADLEDRISQALGESPVTALIAAEDVRTAWDAMPLRDRKRVVDRLMTVVILPAGKGARFDPEQIRVDWKGSRS